MKVICCDCDCENGGSGGGGAVSSVRLDRYLTAFLRNVAGSNNMNVTGPEEFMCTAPEEGFYMARMLIAIIDPSGVNASEFGGIPALRNGVKFGIKSAVGYIDLLDGETIKTNGDFASYAGVDVAQLSGERGVGARWTFTKGTGGKLLELMPGDQVVMTVQDDLRRLMKFTAAIQGVLGDPPDA